MEVSSDGGSSYKALGDTPVDFVESDVPKKTAPGMYLSTTSYSSKTCNGCALTNSAYKVRVVATNHFGSTRSTVGDVAGVSITVRATALFFSVLFFFWVTLICPDFFFFFSSPPSPHRSLVLPLLCLPLLVLVKLQSRGLHQTVMVAAQSPATRFT